MIRTWAPDDFWQVAQPLIPVPPPRPQGGGTPRVSDRAVLAAIVYMVQAGCSWRKLPAVMFGTSRATVHRRFTEWTSAGLWERLHAGFLTRLNVASGIDWSRAVVDSISVRAEKRGMRQGQTRSTAANRARRSHPLRPQRNPARGPDHRRERPRLAGHGATARLLRPDPRPTRPATTPSQQTPRRQGIRHPGTTSRDPPQGHHRADRPQERRILPTAWPPPLDRRISTVLAAQQSSPRTTLRTQSRTLPSLRRPRLRPTQLPPMGEDHHLRQSLTSWD
jgi:transposase